MDTQCGWIIVVFSEDNSVEVVPYSWLKKGTCAKKIIEKSIKPNKIDFNFYNARQLGSKTYSVLSEARLKLPKAVLKSDLSSAEDNYFDKRQKTLKRYNDSISPTTNKLKKNNHNHFKTNTSNMCPPHYVSKGSDSSDDSDDNTTWEVTKKSHIENDKDVIDNYTQNSITEITPTDIGKVNQSIISATTLLEDIEPKVVNTSSINNISSTNIAVKRKLFYEDNYSRQITGHDSEEKSTNGDILTAIKDFKSVILTSHAYMKHELQAMMYLCQTTNENVEKLIKEKSSFIPVQNDDVNMEMFPITDGHGLKILEEQIKDNGFRTSMIRKISLLIGNKDLGNSVRRIMSRMFDDKFLTNYSLFGFKKKKSFSCLSCCRLIIDALRTHLKYKYATEKEIEIPLGTWLSHAPFRLKKVEA
ncbi:MATH and LRR domain-containing protein PFE0570w-like [Metopolophium dirhodum]|uniref:MATH and LRR domain-containing protein PFE0570w-like n=1 Tax=Metopolophium dirhodum TaxID=44670 RepID=UPI00298FE603|nr:MATH and LRR domain-containing protein PFE0570w-like [Metopolophium dirhodum]